MKKNKRPSWHKYFMDIAKLVGKRSTCLSRQVGAIAVKNRRILATGYNGQIIGAKHCEVCLRKDKKSGTNLQYCKAVHAEENIVAQAAQYGMSLTNATIYCTIEPCNRCFKLLANTSIESIIYLNEYPDPITNILIEDSDYYKESFKCNNTKYFIITKMDKFLFHQIFILGMKHEETN